MAAALRSAAILPFYRLDLRGVNFQNLFCQGVKKGYTPLGHVCLNVYLYILLYIK